MIDYVEFYHNLVVKGLDINKVPKKYRNDVKKMLEADK